MRVATNLMWFLLAMVPAAIGGAASPDTVVRERQADMKAMSAAAKSLADTFAGKKSYDIDAFRADAHLIAAMGGERLVGHFVSVTTAEGSHARAEIATNRVKFDKLAHDLSAYAAQVAAAASGDRTMPEAMRMRSGEMTDGGPFARKRSEQTGLSSYSSEHAFHMMLQACSSCHAAFRLKR